jgi:hypothetical protein
MPPALFSLFFITISRAAAAIFLMIFPLGPTATIIVRFSLWGGVVVFLVAIVAAMSTARVLYRNAGSSGTCCGASK